MSQRRNLVLVRAGDQSTHPEWLEGADRNFDIFVSYFGKQEDRYADSAEYHENRKGMKWPILGELLQAHPELVDRYAYFWFPDDDLVASTETVNRMFDHAAAFQLALSQPALTRDSYFTWPLLLHDASYELRFTRFIEVMGPVFDRSALRVCLPSFTESTSGWGLDSLWPGLLADRGEEAIAIIDAAPVRHSRPVGGGELYKNTGMSVANQDKAALFAKYGLTVDVLADARYFSGGVRRVRPGWLATRLAAISRSLRQFNYRRLERRERRNATKHPQPAAE